VHMLSTWQQSRRDSSIVSALAQEHRALQRQRSQLSSRSSLEAEARQLGMMYRGERPYVIPGCPATEPRGPLLASANGLRERRLPMAPG